jgi:hypothetical protein
MGVRRGSVRRDVSENGHRRPVVNQLSLHSPRSGSTPAPLMAEDANSRESRNVVLSRYSK